MKKHVIESLNKSLVDVNVSELTHEAINTVATQARLLPQLHQLFLHNAPPETNLKKYYHHVNLRSALKNIAENADSSNAIKNFF